ncbi:DedA family protein [Nocardioides montaniterrae]
MSALLAQASNLSPLAISLHDLTKWLRPEFLLHEFGTALFWVGIIVLFIECGLLFPFLPGDTLLFAMGLFIAEQKVDIVPGSHVIDLVVCVAVYATAAFAGNVTGYEIGAKIGPRVYQRDGRIVKRVYLERTSEFFDRHGHMALIAGRFVPFVRTYITLVAGVTQMKRKVFLVWSGVGAILWVASLTLIGYVLGQTFPSLGKYIDLVTYGLLAVTVVALAYEIWHKRHDDHVRREAAARETDASSH